MHRAPHCEGQGALYIPGEHVPAYTTRIQYVFHGVASSATREGGAQPMPLCYVAVKGPCVCIAMHSCAPRIARSILRILFDNQGRIGLADCPHLLNIATSCVLRYCFQTAASQMGKLSMQQVLFSHTCTLDCNHCVFYSITVFGRALAYLLCMYINININITMLAHLSRLRMNLGI